MTDKLLTALIEKEMESGKYDEWSEVLHTTILSETKVKKLIYQIAQKYAEEQRKEIKKMAKESADLNGRDSEGVAWFTEYQLDEWLESLKQK